MTALTARPGPAAARPAGDGGAPSVIAGVRPRRGYASGKADYLSRLAKIEGQGRGLRKMVVADAWCPDVVIRGAPATRARQEVAVRLLTDHLQPCVGAAGRASEADGRASLAGGASTI